MTTTPVALPPRSNLARSVLAFLDLDHIDRVAHDTARRIVWADSAIAILQPSETAVYEVTLVRTDVAGVVVDLDRPAPVAPRPTGYDWFTVGINRAGLIPARWNATVAPSDDDVVTCWQAFDRDHAHVAVVLATFLQSVAVHYTAERATQAEQDIF